METRVLLYAIVYIQLLRSQYTLSAHRTTKMSQDQSEVPYVSYEANTTSN